MTATTNQSPVFLGTLSRELSARYRCRVRDLKVLVRDGAAELLGEADCYHTLQLVIRDVAAAVAPAAIRNRITVVPRK